MIHLDLETCSDVDLKKAGLYRYAIDPSTDVLCVSWQARGIPGVDAGMQRWMRGDPPPKHLFDLIANGFMVKAHNCAFDAELWRVVLSERYGWHWPGYDAFYDSMAQAQLTNLPGALEKAAEFFGTAEKDMAGHALMMKLCKPKKHTKNLRDEWRHHTAEDLKALSDYCCDDVLAEAGFSVLVPKLKPFEERVWRETWAMNRRGLMIDLPLAARCRELALQIKMACNDEICRITGGDVEKATQREKLGKWLEEHGASVPRTKTGRYSISKDTRDLLDLSECGEEAHEVMEQYDLANKNADQKFDAMLRQACPDSRVRGVFAYSGASQTGRWAGRGVQTQNLNRGIFDYDTIEETIAAYERARTIIMDGAGPEELEMLYGSAMGILSTMIRPCFIAGPGKKYIQADYSAIEGRLLAWAAGEKHVLRAYREKKRLYAVAAAGIFNVPYEAIYDQSTGAKLDGFKDKIGKIAELACGYQGWTGAFDKMGGASLGLDEERTIEILSGWRDSHPATTLFWERMVIAAVHAVENPGKRFRAGPAIFGFNGDHLKMRLPSGRCLWYRKAQVIQASKPTKHKKFRKTIKFYGVDDNGRVGWITTYGGKLTENLIQAMGRDLLAHAHLNCIDRGLEPVMTLHDELVCEVDENGPDHNILCEAMDDIPAWAPEGLIVSEGWTGNFFMKT